MDIERATRITVLMIAFASIMYAMWHTANMRGGERQQLLSVVLACFVALVLIFVVDKLAVDFIILSAKESEAMFDLISSIMLLAVGFYWGSQTKGE